MSGKLVEHHPRRTAGSVLQSFENTRQHNFEAVPLRVGDYGDTWLPVNYCHTVRKPNVNQCESTQGVEYHSGIIQELFSVISNVKWMQISRTAYTECVCILE